MAMRIVQITTDNREHFSEYDRSAPYFGTAPAGLLDGFEQLGHVEVHVISCARRAAPVPEKIGRNIWFHQPLVGRWGWGRTFFAGCIKEVRRLVRIIDPDIVHGQGTERDCAIDAVLSGRPNVLTLHGNMRVHAARPENKGNSYYRLAAALERFCLRRTDGVIAISRYTRDLVSGDARKTWLLPNAVDRRFFEVAPEHHAEVPGLLFVGTFDERKNPIGLIEACEPMLRANVCRIVFAGQSIDHADYSTRFEALARSTPGVEVRGFLGREALAREFSKAQIVVLPTFEDNCPMVVLEAMAAGLPVAASKVGGVPDLLDHDVNGLMFDPNAPETMRTSLEFLVTDAALRRRLGESGRQTARKRFHPEVIARRHIEIYREVLGR